ncbi:MAG: hypothetical protein L0J40_07555 [Alkalibacterium sp.]|nr:hypothetical protein [Alkalibacterium sp.]
MFVIVQARNELRDVLMPLKVVSDIEHQDSIGSDLVKRNWASAGLAGGSTLFAGIAAGSYQLAKTACSPAILARLAVFTMSVGVEYCFFWAGLTLLSASVLSLLAVGAGSQGWKWETGLEQSKRDEIVNVTYLERAGFELISHGLSYSITDNVESDNWEDRLHQAGYLHGMTLAMSDNGKRSDNDAHIVITGKKGTRTGTTILVRPEIKDDVMHMFADHLLGVSSNVSKRYELEWESYDYDGYDGQGMAANFVDIDQGNLQKYHQNINELADNFHLSDNVDGDKQVPKKLCMAWGGSSSAGSDTFMLGEVYSEDFGGVDGDCEGA